MNEQLKKEGQMLQWLNGAALLNSAAKEQWQAHLWVCSMLMSQVGCGPGRGKMMKMK